MLFLNEYSGAKRRFLNDFAGNLFFNFTAAHEIISDWALGPLWAGLKV